MPSNRFWTVNGGRPTETMPLPPLDTRYSFTWRTSDGGIDDRVRMGPCTPLFTDAFTALGRGSLVMTAIGPVAVEDLLPGDRIITALGVVPLMWKGSRSIAPQHRNMPLHRIASDALGPSRPLPDLVLGPAARLVTRRMSHRPSITAEEALMPIEAFADDNSVVRIRPISVMEVFHLGFERHTIFTANGVEMESVHPGKLPGALHPELRELYMSMFPHLQHETDFGELSMPRIASDAALRRTG